MVKVMLSTTNSLLMLRMSQRWQTARVDGGP